ncbi:MAG: sulfate adenylyltransferase subunit CysD [Gemmatimonadota bacterium]|nr:sulfate adenylyltransferase subunit CysD [Gemmatimonadota bacterium]
MTLSDAKTGPHMSNHTISHLDQLEAESIHIMREVAAEFERPVMMYSVGKDSSVMLRLAQKAFYPQTIPFPLLHVDTGYKFRDMYAFRDKIAKDLDAELIVYRNEEAISDGANPFDLGTQRCCGLLKTQALLDALKAGDYDAAIGGARREEEKSRAKERVFSFRDRFGQWDPKNQRPELWNLYNCRIAKGESIRVFPLSNWTELDIWMFIHREEIPIVPMYFAEEREVVVRGEQIIPLDGDARLLPGETPERLVCRFRTLGCSPCTGAVRSEAQSVEDIIAEMMTVRTSERSTRIIDHDQEGSMEIKKREGYF